MKIELNDVTLNYHVSGEGKEVILLHGWGANIQAFAPIHQNLEKNFKVYSLDLPGFGESTEPPEQWGIKDYTEVLRQFIEKIGITKPILMGHSFGGRMSICYSATYKDVEKVILVDSAGIKPKRKASYYLKVYTFKTAKNVLKLPGLNRYSDQILSKVKKMLGSSDYKSASGVMQQTMVKVVNEDLQHLMPEIDVPTLLVFGENDTATPVADGKRMEELIPNAGLVVLKNAGHYAYLDQLNQFNVIINKFLEDDRRSL
ncbi:alpha/beta hydrolase [Salipaludibacillus keqinensis]|uniref:Alpha/beta hydrolase n=1 Tax=Salipaludibacillus keqinensis TaxID=2045207 RepID=A0A323TI58_9BACI|nr:alpha/beta hydrolase [Salipaludibacillus keqinensis]PYZ93856.1 alpha/beta hydrolase [Salipaludibacillus keqinensis]